MDEKQNSPGCLLAEVDRAHHNLVQAALSARGLELGAPIILMILLRRARAGGAATQREIADELHVSPAAVAVSLKSLERGGYIEKRTDPADARCNRVVLSPRGEEAVHLCRTVFAAADALTFRGLTPAETALLMELLCKMLKNLREGVLELPAAEGGGAVC